VKLLGQAVIRYFASIASVVGVHPVDVARYSASSYASHAVQGPYLQITPPLLLGKTISIPLGGD
jgi:hypothetical protein